MMSNLQSQVGELKSQGVAEASRDPESNVTALDAEKSFVNETKKAGGLAFNFNPDASPEEKAAEARSHLPTDFHHIQKSAAVGVVTDIGDSKPDAYDLPPPSKEGAITEPPADDAAEKTNGHVAPDDEEKRIRERVGWKSRFGQGDLTEAEANESLLDHTTFLETKIDDKFFGDWYQNAAVIVVACIASWLVAILGGGIGWLMIVMAFCGTYYRTSIRRVRRNFRDDVHRELAKAQLETDTESLEWINSFLVKFWPIYAPILCETIIASVDQVLSTSTPAFLDSLRMKTFILGTKPPRLEHVKTYPKADDDLVLMDWKFSFTPNDTMDLTARQLKNKINPKVALEVRIGVGVVSKGLDVIVEDFAFSGLMRVKVKLQLPFPHIEKVEICFLGKPDIDYVCKPLGGDTLGFDINFIPGLESFITEQIHGNLAPIMYAPNVFPIEIAKMLAGGAVDQAIGVLTVTIHGAQGLKNSDKLGGSVDPYVVVALNGRDPLGKTKIIKQNSNPRWNETVYVIITSFTDALTLQVFDFNEFRKDKMLGTATFALDQLEKDNEHTNLQLEVLAGGKARGVVQSDIRFFPVLQSAKGPDGKEAPPPESNTGIAKFTVEQAKDLDGSKSLIGQLNPYAVLLLNGQEIHVSQKLKRTNQPIWANGSKEFLVTDRKKARLGVVVKDDRDVSADPVLGAYQIKLDDLMKLQEEGKEWYNLSGAKTGRAKLLLQWKPVALKGAIGGSGGYITPIGVMRIHFQNARGLRNVETMGKSDPYARVLLSGIEKGKTVTFQNNLDPDWDEVIYVPMHSSREKFLLEVMDYQNIGKDRSLGEIELLASDYIHETESGEFEAHEEKKQRSELLKLHGKGTPKGTLNFTVAFYPTLNIVDPEEEEEEKEAEAATNGVQSRDASKASFTSITDPVDAANRKEADAGKINTKLAKDLDEAEKEQESGEVNAKPKLRLTPEELLKYQSGLLIFKLIEGDLSRTNVRLEVLMDDAAFPSYVSAKAQSRHMVFGETGDAFVRELDFSRITMRLKSKEDRKGGDSASEQVVAKREGDTLAALQQCLYKETELSLTGADGASKIKILLKYIPVKMQLDPSESMNNSGTLLVEVKDGKDLPSADRNGYSDPFCKFELNGEKVYQTQVQKKTLQPVWNEKFEIPIQSRTAGKFKVRVYDWDFGGSDDFLGEADINLEMLEPNLSQPLTLKLDGKSGDINLRVLFKPKYVTRSRQGSSTFHGTFAVPGKIVGAPIKGVGKVGGAVGGGVVKGASFMRHGFKSSKSGSKDMTNGEVIGEEPVMNGDSLVPVSSIIPSIETPEQQTMDTSNDGAASTTASTTAASTLPQASSTQGHSRSTSFGTKSFRGGSAPPPGSTGTASFTLLSATGYPAGAKLQIHVKQMSPKAKEIHKSKGIKAASGACQWDATSETFKVQCAPDCQFQIQVKDDKVFGSDELGEASFFIADSESGAEKTVPVGKGSVVLRTSFIPADAASVAEAGSPKASGAGNRKSFLQRPRREVTPS